MTKIGIAYREQLTIYDDKLAKSDGSSYFEKRLMYFCAETTELWRRQRERLYVKGSAKILDKPADVPATVELALAAKKARKGPSVHIFSSRDPDGKLASRLDQLNREQGYHIHLDEVKEPE